MWEVSATVLLNLRSFSASPAARLWQWNNTQSHGLPGFKDLHCVRRWIRLSVGPHTCSGAHGSLRCSCYARLRSPRKNKRIPCGHQRPSGTGSYESTGRVYPLELLLHHQVLCVISRSTYWFLLLFYLLLQSCTVKANKYPHLHALIRQLSPNYH